MYKVLLCWRYLRTRYLALACVVSVMLGVATLIVVNSVMNGFSGKLRDRLHGILSDIVIESPSIDGFADARGKMDKIKNDPFLRDKIEAMTPTMEVFAMLQFRYPNGVMMNRHVKVLGVEPESRAKIGGFSEYLQDKRNKAKPTMELPAEVRERIEDHERRVRHFEEQEQRHAQPVDSDVPPPLMPTPFISHVPRGAYVGHLIAFLRYTDPNTKESKEAPTLLLGDPITLITVTGSESPAPVKATFMMVDTFKSDMSEYDSHYVFVPLDYLQQLRGLDGRATSIQIKLKDFDADSADVKMALANLFPHEPLRIDTWEDKQGPLLRAIQIEKNILNVLLFMIVAVAGFGILAIFSMIVTEKTRDIGILKALGASSGGIMRIFLGYGLLLGAIGALAGTGLGVTLTVYINDIERGLAHVSGQHIFNPEIYYFKEIPTEMQPAAIFLVNLGAMLIAIVFSILPALKAAMLQPVQALRYE